VGAYRNEDESLVGVARELAYAYIDASGAEDADYAADEIADFLLEREALPDEALIALLDLPADGRTRWLLDKVAATLSARGAEVAGLLLAAMLPGTAPHRAEHAAAIVDGMDERELIAGFIGLLASRAGDELKLAGVAALVALGEPCAHALERALSDPVAAPWARDALDELRGAGTPAAQSQIAALEAAFAADTIEPTRPAAEGDRDHLGPDRDDDGR
jgi:hypothetical protein